MVSPAWVVSLAGLAHRVTMAAPEPSPQNPNNPPLMSLVVAITVCLTSLCGIALTLLTLPGIWIAILVAGLAQWWSIAQRGELMFSWWTLGACAAIGIAAEVAELLASAAGAAKAGGTRRGAIGSVIGGVVGAIGGSFFLPPLGTILGAAVGAGAGALLLELEHSGGRKTWKESSKIGAGAAAGRLVATIIKASLATVIAVILSVAAFR